MQEIKLKDCFSIYYDDAITYYYALEESGCKYIGTGGNDALVLYKISNDENIVGFNLGFREEDQQSYNCDIERIINSLYFYGVGKELLEKFDVIYADKKMPPCSVTIEGKCAPSSSLDSFIISCDKKLDLYHDTKRLDNIINSIKKFSHEDYFKLKSKIYK